MQDGALTIVNTSDEGQQANLMLYIANGFTVREGLDYIVRIEYMSNVDGNVNVTLGNRTNSLTKTDVAITASGSYQTLELEYNKVLFASEGDNGVILQCRKVVGTIKIRKVEVVEISSDKPIAWTNIIVNSELSGDDMSCFYQEVYPETEASQSSATNGAIVINSPAKGTGQGWETGFFIVLPQALPAGTPFKVSFRCKASTPTTITPQCHNAPGQYVHWNCFGDVDFDTEWMTYEATAYVPEYCDGGNNAGGYKNDFRTICFNLTKDEDITYYFSNIVVAVDAEIAINPQPFPAGDEITNVIYVQDAEMPVEKVQEHAQTVELSIWMKNTAPIRGFEFDMYLPEGISVKKNNKGRIMGVSFNAGRLPEDDEHTLTLSELSDGAVHFVCGSMYDETFTGNDGEIMTMEVNLSANIAVGDYPIRLKNIKLTETNPSNYYETELMESVFRVTGDSGLPEFVVLPEGLRAWEWELEGQLSDGDFHTDAQVAFDGTDVYLRGLSSINEEAWIKGTLDTETNLITFPCGQYVGLDADDPIYLVGLSYKNFCDIVFEYDVYAQTLTQVTPAILENGNTRTLDVRYYWEDVVLKSGQTVSFTVRYVDEEGNEIKPARIGWGEIGGQYDMHGSDHDPIYSDDGQTKYKYISMIGDYHYLEHEPENNIITLVFRKGSLCYASVNCMSNGYFDLLAQYEETFYDCDELTIHLPWGLRDSNGRCFFTSSNTGEGNHGRNVRFPSNYEPAVRYGKTYYTAAVLYNEDPSVAYYADCATLVLPPEGNEYGKGLGQIDGSYRVRQNGGWSLGNTISLREDSYLWTEPIAEAGTYRVEIYLHKAFTEVTDEPFVFGYRDAEGNKFLYTDLNIPAYGEGYYVGTNITENVSIPAGASLIVMNRLPENEVSLDDITLYKTDDFVEPIADGIQDLKDLNDLKDSKDFKDNKAAIYNLAGQRLQKMQKGINIVGGKKILR